MVSAENISVIFMLNVEGMQIQKRKKTMKRYQYGSSIGLHSPNSLPTNFPPHSFPPQYTHSKFPYLTKSHFLSCHANSASQLFSLPLATAAAWARPTSSSPLIHNGLFWFRSLRWFGASNSLQNTESIIIPANNELQPCLQNAEF